MDDRLQKFAQLVHSGSFTQAAHVLRISQPALTLAITKLERELRTPLLIRSKKKLEMTSAGRLAYATATEHRTLNDNLLAGLQAIASARPIVRVGMIDSVAAIICAATEPLQTLESDADVSIMVDNSRNLRQAIVSRSVDLILVVNDDSSAHPAVSTRLLGNEPLVVICHPERLEALQSGVDRGRLSDLICYDRSSMTHAIILQALSEHHIKLQPIFYSTSPDVILQMVLLGKGVAALPYSQCRDLLETGALSALEVNDRTIVIKRPIAMLKLNARNLPAALQIFSEQAKDLLGSVWQESFICSKHEKSRENSNDRGHGR